LYGADLRVSRANIRLLNMPVFLKANQIDDYIWPILQSAWEGRFDLIKNLG
jgi:hypothetical protein